MLSPDCLGSRAGKVAAKPLDVLIAGDDEEARAAVARLVEAGGSKAVDVGSLRRTRELERPGFLGMTVQQPLGLNFKNAWKLASQATTGNSGEVPHDTEKPCAHR